MCFPHTHTRYMHSCCKTIKSLRLGKTSKIKFNLCVRLRQCWYQLPVFHVLPISRDKCTLTHVHTTLCTPSKHNLSFAHSQKKQIHRKIIIMYILSLTHAKTPTNLHALSPSTHPSSPPTSSNARGLGINNHLQPFNPPLSSLFSRLQWQTGRVEMQDISMQRRGGGNCVSIKSRKTLLNPVEVALASCNQLSRAATVPEISCFIPRTSMQNRTGQ